MVKMSRIKFILYIVGLHLVMGASGCFLLLDNRPWILALEVLLLISFLVGLGLIRAMSSPADLMETGRELIEEGDFTTTFRKTGDKEMDRLISLFNEMIVKLRDERQVLEERNFFLHELLHASPSGIIILDYDGLIQEVNPAIERLFEISNDKLAGKPLSWLTAPFGEALASLEPEASFVVPFRGNRRMKCGKSRFMDKGFHRHFILIEELTHEIRESEKSAYEKLIRLMSHEVNNSVGAVGSLLNSCLYYAGQIDAPDRKDFETAMKISIDRLGNLNKFMKGYAEIVRLPDPVLQESDILALVRDCAELFRGESDKRRISWQWDAKEEIPRPAVDRGQMEQVFINIFKNAMDAIDGPGSIAVKTAAVAQKRLLIIEDTGNGISDEAREKLFTPFYSTKSNGQGIGLTLVQEILNRHNLEFSLVGAPGGPTRFTIHFRP